MIRTTIITCILLLLNINLRAQKDELITVKAGHRILDYFPVTVRYRYPEFVAGKIMFKNGTVNSPRLNYNLLLDEMEFIQAKDTLALVRKKEIRYIAVEVDTFYYDNGFLEQLSGGTVRVCLRQRIKLKEVLKQDPYGTSSSGSASTSYGVLPTDANFYKLTPNEDMVFQKTREYYLLSPGNEFVQFRKKTVLQLYPQKNAEIQKYIKSNKVDFDSRDDLLRFAEYLRKVITVE
jgi:hypothetical protein